MGHGSSPLYGDVIGLEESDKTVDTLHVRDELPEVREDDAFVKVRNDLWMPDLIARVTIEVERTIEQLLQVLSQRQNRRTRF